MKERRWWRVRGGISEGVGREKEDGEDREREGIWESKERGE